MVLAHLGLLPKIGRSTTDLSHVLTYTLLLGKLNPDFNFQLQSFDLESAH